MIKEKILKKLIKKDIDRLFAGNESLKEKNKHLSYLDLLQIALDFLGCKEKIDLDFTGVRGFMFDGNRIIFVVNESVDEEKKKQIRESLVGFVDFNEIAAKINNKKMQ